jgi:hypothetical protein
LIRLLGARLPVQGTAALVLPATLLADAAVDFTHAVAMLAVAVLRPDDRRVAVPSGVTAVLSAALGAVAARGTR